MSRVFVARDETLGRDVVVKVLAPFLTEGLSVERFAREIRLAAALQEPHIVPVHAAGTTEDGIPYYTMPFVVGESLRARLANGTLPVAETIEILRDVATALEYAHAHGIVHRDIKPENILLSGRTAVVTDFGIAKALEASKTQASGDTLTQAGMSIGTPAYMAPEQALGDVVDARADLYAWGVLAYEALAGRHPFASKTTAQALIAAHVMDIPASLAAQRRDLPGNVEAIVMRCLEKDPERRPTGAGEVLAALAAPATAWVTPTSAAATVERSIAVLPFVNLSADVENEYFSDGLSDEIRNALAKLSGLRVMARTSSFAFKGRNVDVRTVGEQLGARFVLDGSVRKAGARVRITAQLVDAEEGHQLWSERYDRDMSDVFAMQDEITGAIRDALSERLLGIGVARPQATPPIDAATYELYLRGRHMIEQRVWDTEAGARVIEEVLSRAPGYAPAYTQLAVAHAARIYYGVAAAADEWPIVRTLAEQSVAIDPSSAGAYFLLAEAAFHFERDWERAARLFAHALQVDGANDGADSNYGQLYLSALGRFDEAIALTTRALDLDPFNPASHLRATIPLYLSRRFEEAIRECDRAIALFPDYAESHRWKGCSLLAMGRLEGSIDALRTAVRVSDRSTWALFNLGTALVAANRRDEARPIADELERRAEHRYVPQLALVLGPHCAQPEDLDRVFQLLGEWCDERAWWTVMLGVDATFDWLRRDPRFDALVRRVGVPVAR
jgi:serine/threonine-protein kinase